MPATLSTISPLLKEVYQGRVREQLQSEVTLLKRIESSSDGVTTEVGGKYVTFPVHTRRNSGLGARNEGEALPIPGQQGTAAARIGLAYLYGSGQITGQAVQLSDSNTKAFAKALDFEMDGLKVDLRKDFNRQLYGTGSGAVGTVSAVGTASTTITVSDASKFQLGMQVDLVTLPSTVVNSNIQVTAVNASTAPYTITVSTAVTSAVGQILVRNGSVGREINGLGAIVDNATALYNIDPSVEPTWKSEIDQNGGTLRALSEGLMIQMRDRIRINGGDVSLILTSLGVRNAYFSLLSQQRQVVNTQEFTGGFKGLAFITDDGEIPVISDVDAPKNTMYFLNEKDLTLYQDEDWNFIDYDGSMFQRKIDASGTYDAFFFTMRKYCNLGTDRRNTHGVIKDINAPY